VTQRASDAIVQIKRIERPLLGSRRAAANSGLYLAGRAPPATSHLHLMQSAFAGDVLRKLPQPVVLDHEQRLVGMVSRENLVRQARVARQGHRHVQAGHADALGGHTIIEVHAAVTMRVLSFRSRRQRHA
jgi:hypothetical protein